MTDHKGFTKRGNYWHVDVTIGGVRRRVSTGRRDIDAAISWASTSGLTPNTAAYRSAKRDTLRLLDSARARAAASGEPFTLNAAFLESLWIQTGGRCAVTGIPFSRILVDGCRRAPFKPSLDRIRRGAGYTPDNVRLVCVAVNTAINEWGDAVFRAIVVNCAKRVRAGAY